MYFFLLSALKAAVVAAALLTTLAYLQWIERKVIAHIQLRMGPYRVGPHGLLQPVADVIKLLTKEDLLPSHANRFLFLLAPFLAVALALTSIAVIPFGPQVDTLAGETYMQLTDINIGILFLLAISSLGVYAVAIAGWASNNKYALLGSLRAAAQMISYELPLALALAAPLLMAGSLSLRDIAMTQSGHAGNWMIFQMPAPQIVGFLIFLISAFAETNRIPFDLPEAENELVAGFHTEYSSLKFASFFMAEYANMITIAAITTTVFLGSWHPVFPVEWGSNFVPSVIFAVAGALALYHGLNFYRKRDRMTLPVFAVAFFGLALLFAIPAVQTYLLPLFWFLAKTGALLFLFIWVRGTMPRFRYDQLMQFAWKFLFPLSVVNLLATAFLVAVFGE
ncbi:MAG: NADH-quinone oxidoreductase subunit NuoH [bacterium]|nr:NADH-quinone oxidoreductase subunit NuoH [bacterium]